MKNKEYILQVLCTDKIGIVSSITTTLADAGLFILECSQFSDKYTNKFFMRVHFETTTALTEPEIKNILTQSFKPLNITWQLYNLDVKPKVLLMVSKYSHCLNDILYRWSTGNLKIDIPAVVSNHQDLENMVSWYKIPFYYLPINSNNNKFEQEQKLLNIINQYQIDLVVLARYMQILSKNFCNIMPGKIINIHHSFLPSFKGAKPYNQAFERGVKLIGATSHYVTTDLDEGPIIEQEITRVRHDQTLESLIQMGQDIESLVLARAIKWHIEHRIFINSNKTVVFN